VQLGPIGAGKMPSLDWVRANQIGRISLILLLAFVALVAINYVSLPFAPCVEPLIVSKYNNANADANEEYMCPEIRGIISAGLYRLNDWSAAEWTAAATLFLTIYTGILATAARAQVRLTGNQVALTRDEFIATHRPRLRVRRFQLHPVLNDGRMNVTFTIVNVGNSQAVLNESRGNIDIVPPAVVPMPIYGNELRQVIEPRVFAPGTDDEGSITSRPRRDEGVIIRVYGYLSYVDGLENVRTTGFCRIWDNGSQRFKAVKDPDSEYED
jgi:hypothetical protein